MKKALTVGVLFLSMILIGCNLIEIIPTIPGDSTTTEAAGSTTTPVSSSTTTSTRISTTTPSLSTTPHITTTDTGTTMETITVDFDSNGGSEVTSMSFLSGEDLALPIPVRDGYLFSGWYTDQGLSEGPFLSTNQIFVPVVLYACWIFTGYELTLEMTFPADVLYDFIQVDSCSGGNLALTADQRILAWGLDLSGKYGIGYQDYLPTLNDITDCYPLSEGERFIKVELGLYHSLVLTDSGRLFGMGRSEDGELGTTGTYFSPILVNDWLDLAAGETVSNVFSTALDTFVVTSENRIFAMGINNSGQLGVGDLDPRSSAVEITDRFGLSEDDAVAEIVNSFDFNYDYYLLSQKGRLFVWLSSTTQQMGYRTYLDLGVQEITQVIPLHSGEIIRDAFACQNYIAVLTSESRILVWGNLSTLGLGETANIPLEVTEDLNLGLGESVTQITMDSSNLGLICFTDMDRVLYYGCGDLAGLKVGAESPLVGYDLTADFDLNQGDRLTFIGGDHDYFVALTEQGNLFSWGSGQYGNTGTGLLGISTYPEDIQDGFYLGAGEDLVDFCAGEFVSYAITSESRVFAWGLNFFGGLGPSDSDYSMTPKDISGLFAFSEGDFPTMIRTGSFQTVLLTDTGRVIVWGRNYEGILGTGTGDQICLPTDITSLFGLSGGDRINAVFTAYTHTLFVSEQGKIFYCGGGHNSPVRIDGYLPLSDGEIVVGLFDNYYFCGILTSLGRFLSFVPSDFYALTSAAEKDFADLSLGLGLNDGELIRQVSFIDRKCYILTTHNRVFSALCSDSLSNTWTISEVPVFDGGNYPEFGTVTGIIYEIWGIYLLTENSGIKFLKIPFTESYPVYQEEAAEVGDRLFDVTWFLSDLSFERMTGSSWNVIFLSGEGHLFTLGYRLNGQLGSGNQVSIGHPVLIVSKSLEYEAGQPLPTELDGYSVRYFLDRECTVEILDPVMPEGNCQYYVVPSLLPSD